MRITFVHTGGTIDKDYPRSDAHHGYAFTVGRPAAAAILRDSHIMFEYDVVETVKKDSLDLTDADRRKIAAAVKQASDRVIVTHGTDTLLKTAEVLHGEIKDKTVILTGAMLPEKFVNSDAKFNVGMAASAAQILPPGVYIALYGRVVPWQEFKGLHEAYERQTANSR